MHATPTTDPVALWQKAASYAAFKHRHQLRKDGKTPYIAHPFRVCMTLRQLFGCEDPHVLAAALLHDLIEDTTTDYEDISHRFGELTADLVAAMTKNAALPDPRRETEYDAQLARADWRARLLKLADVYDNLSDSLAAPDTSVPLEDTAGRARRAVALAAADTKAHPEAARGVAAVQDLLKSAGALMARRAPEP
jgi:guanosine-3',5'-bis(diphosphate) 3'-pyrophosphohydrolase